MKTRSLRLLIGCLLILGCLYFAAGTCFSLQNPTENSKSKNYTITWGKIPTLIFDGAPNQSQAGELTYILNTNFKCRRYKISIHGTPFRNGECSLETRYQSDTDQLWHMAGEPMIIEGTVGVVNKIFYQVKSGPNISSQPAGSYSAKLAITVLAFE